MLNPTAQHVARTNTPLQVGVNAAAAYTQTQWKSDMTLAKGKGIDAFVLNIATPLQGSTADQIVCRLLDTDRLVC